MIDQLANRQQEVEVQLLREIPANYQILHWQLKTDCDVT